MPAKATYLAPMISELPHLGIHKKRPGIVLKTLQVIPALLHNQTRQPKATNPFAQHREPFTGHCHFALRVQFENIEPQGQHQMAAGGWGGGFRYSAVVDPRAEDESSRNGLPRASQHMLSIRETVL